MSFGEDTGASQEIEKEKQQKEADDQKTRDKYKKAEVKKIIYFEEDTIASCNDISSFTCPPLTAQRKKEGYSTIIQYINPIAGELKCGVFNLADTFFIDDGTSGLNAIHEQVFKRKACVDKFNIKLNAPTQADGGDYTELESLTGELRRRQQDLKEMQVKYEVDFKQSGGEQYLDMADWLDALATIDGEKIDLETTLAQWEVKTTEGYTIVPNDILVGDYESNMHDLMKMYNGDMKSSEVNAIVEDRIRMNEVNKVISNSQYVMYLDFFINSNEAFNEALHLVMMLFVSWNVVMGWLFNGVTKWASSGDSGQDHWNKGIFGVIAFVILYSGSSEQYMIMDENGDKIKEISVKTTKVQSLVRTAYSASNDISDKIAKIAIGSYLRGLSATSGVATVEALNSIASERKALKEEKKILKEAHDMCMSTYDTAKLVTKLRDYRSRNLSSNSGSASGEEWHHMSEDIDELSINPFPKSEREAFACMMDKNYKLISNPYASANADSLGGFVSNNFYNTKENVWFEDVKKFASGDGAVAELYSKDMISLSGCNYNMNKIITNTNRVADLDSKIEAMKDKDKHEKTLKHLKIVNEMMWKNYGELGYISIAFLPATSLIIDAQSMDGGALGDAKAREQIMQDATNGGGESYAQELAKAMPMMALFGGNAISEMIYNLFNSGTEVMKSFLNKAIGTGSLGLVDKTIDWVLNSNQDGEKNPIVMLISLYTTQSVISHMLNAALFITLIGLSITAFTVLSLQKLWTFFATMFLAIHIFSDKQTEKISASIGKMMATAFKNVLLVISIFLAIYSMSLIDSFEAILVNGFFSNMDTLYHANKDSIISSWNPMKLIYNAMSQTIFEYSYYGMAHLGMQIIKIYLVIYIITKLPAYFYDLLDVNVNDVGDEIMNKIQDSNERESTKGL
ncbi:MAG: hypothetical protein DRG78_00120 [Epsilonproteobacteria bacterium]|nr:MAG: hypothetical protein DRG78_00120 [Campylobacterota bacterium]